MTITIKSGNVGCAFVGAVYILSAFMAMIAVYLLGAPIYSDRLFVGPLFVLPVLLILWGIERLEDKADKTTKK